MKLAEGRRRMMAAMAQQDCGQCGYTCQDYSDGIALQKEERLNLCVPTGKETTRTLKAPYQELDNSSSAPASVKIPMPAVATAAPAAAPGSSRESPAEPCFLSRTRLNKPGSAKETWHIEIDLAQTGIFPSNNPALADAVIAAFVTGLKNAGRYQQDVH